MSTKERELIAGIFGGNSEVSEEPRNAPMGSPDAISGSYQGFPFDDEEAESNVVCFMEVHGTQGETPQGPATVSKLHSITYIQTDLQLSAQRCPVRLHTEPPFLSRYDPHHSVDYRLRLG